MGRILRKVFSIIALVTGVVLAAAIVLDVSGVWELSAQLKSSGLFRIASYAVSGVFVVSAVATLILSFLREQSEVEPIRAQEPTTASSEVAPEYGVYLEPATVEEASAVSDDVQTENAVEPTPVVLTDPELENIEYTGTAQDDELDLDGEFVVEQQETEQTPPAPRETARQKVGERLEQGVEEANDDVSKILQKINAIIDLVKDGDK